MPPYGLIQKLPYEVAQESDPKQDDIERFLQSISSASQGLLETVSDPTLSKFLFQQPLSTDNKRRFGRIQSSMPYLGWYRVAIDGLGGILPCGRMSSDCTPSLFGPIDTVTLPPDTAVVVEMHPTGRFGYITGTVPSIQEDGNQAFSDWVVQGGNASFREEYYSAYINKTGDEGGVIDFSNQRPLDNLTTDWGRTMFTGMMLHIDPFMSFMRASETCGVFVFGVGERKVCRVVGNELQQGSSVHSLHYQNDEGELSYYYGESYFPWESLGSYSPDVELHTENSDDDVHQKRYLGKYEPKEADQVPFRRYEEYGGYLGQGRIRQMSIPSVQSSGRLAQATEDMMPIGVFQEFVGLNGTYFLGSAKRVTLAKTTLLPVAWRQRPASDYTASDCDSIENNNYRFSGHYGSGSEHKLKPLDPSNQHQQLVSVMDVLDHLTYVSNWQNVLAFHYHEKDFKLPEASVTEFEQNQTTLPFGELAQQTRFSDPEPVELQIDPRWKTKFYKLLSLLDFTDDGGVVLQGGHGEQIRFVGGEIYIDCPGNAYIRSGKSIVNLAGDDWITRAFNSADLTTTTKSIRIKSETDTSFLSGNGGSGGFLFECRATEKTHNYTDEGGEQNSGSGFLVKLPKTQFAVEAAEMYFRTGNTEGEIDEGKIVFDAAKGNQDILMTARKFDLFAKSDFRFNLGFPKVTQTHEMSKSQLTFGTPVSVLGNLRVRGEAQVKLGVEVSDGHYSSPNGGEVSQLPNPGQVRNVLDQINTYHNELIKTEKENYENELQKAYYEKEKIGNDDKQKRISFSMRRREDYNTTSFTMPEAHWQMLADDGGGTKVWKEKVVMYRGEKEMMPWPGLEPWRRDHSLITLPAANHNLYDVSAGAPKNRSAAENPEYGLPVAEIPDDSYLIISVP